MNSEGDVVLVHYQDKPAIYARIEEIQPDVKKDWYQVTFLLLTIPPQTVTWILREEYINGTPFTMGGQPMRLDEVKRISVKTQPEDTSSPDGEMGTEKPAKVIPFKSSSE
jgi:hypothetical protein